MTLENFNKMGGPTIGPRSSRKATANYLSNASPAIEHATKNQPHKENALVKPLV